MSGRSRFRDPLAFRPAVGECGESQEPRHESLSTCTLLEFPRSGYYKQSRRDPWVALRMRLEELAALRPRFGYRRLHIILVRREGWKVNHMLIHRLYYEEGLQVRTRRRRKVAMTAS